MLTGREARETLGTGAFWVTSAVGVLLIVAVAVVQSLIGGVGHWGPSRVGVIDPTGQVTALLTQDAPVASVGAGSAIRFSPWSNTSAALRAAVISGKMTAAVVVTPGTGGLSDAAFQIWSTGGSSGLPQVLSASVRAAILPVRLTAAGLSPAAAARALVSPEIQTQVLSSRSPFVNVANGSVSPVSLGLVYALNVLLMLLITLHGNSILASVSAEKASRVSEVLMVTIRATDLLWAKVVGIGAVALLQLACFAATAGVVYLVDPALRTAAKASFLHGGVPLGAVVPLILFFTLGYLSYAAIFAAIGASVRQPEEARSAAGLPSILVVVGYLATIGGLYDPTAAFVTVGSLLPLFSPFLMFGRIVLGVVPWWQVVVSVAISTGAITLLFRWAAAIYRRNLVSNAPFSLWRLRPRRGAVPN